jgi:CrcB protein
MMLNAILVAAGGFFGAMARYGMSQWINKRFPSTFPIGTFVVNLLGSFLLGLLFGGGWNSSIMLLLGTGFMGAFTTFSTFKLENIHLRLKKEHGIFVRYLGFSYTFGILLAFVGYALGSIWKG